jgi:hypothetical protein
VWPASSLARRPVVMATSIRAWSRRPVQVPGSGALLEEGGDLLLGQVSDDGGAEALAGDGQDAGDVVGVLGCCGAA